MPTLRERLIAEGLIVPGRFDSGEPTPPHDTAAALGWPILRLDGVAFRALRRELQGRQ